MLAYQRFRVAGRALEQRLDSSSNGLLGSVGVLGPRRMDYARVIPVVDYLSHLVTERLSE